MAYAKVVDSAGREFPLPRGYWHALAVTHLADAPTNDDAIVAPNLIEAFGELYTKTREPLFAWAAWRWARALKLDVPSWALKVIDEAATKLCALAAAPPKKPGTAVLVALGMARDGRDSAFARAGAWRDLVLAGRVHLALRDGEALKAALDDAASMLHVNHLTARRALAKYEALFID